MKIKYLFLIFIILAGCSLFNSNEEKKSINDFTWTSDTLWNEDAFQVLMDQIWGSGPDDLYVVGHAADNDHTIYHYDGNTWEVPSYNDRHGGTLTGAFNFDDVWGNSATDVWAVGEGTSIAHPHISYRATHFYHGFWEDIPMESDDVYNRGFASVWGRSTNDVWFTDYRGRVYHYDGSVIKRDTSRVDLVYNESDVYNSYIGGDGEGNVYFSIIKRDEADRTNTFSHVFKKDGGLWREIYRNGVSNIGPYIVIFWTGPDGVLYGTGGGLSFLKNDTWQELLKYDVNDVSGPTADNLLIVKPNGEAHHYNGIEWQEIEVLNHHEINYRFCWYDGKEAFVGGHYGYATIIFHGR